MIRILTTEESARLLIVQLLRDHGQKFAEDLVALSCGKLNANNIFETLDALEKDKLLAGTWKYPPPINTHTRRRLYRLRPAGRGAAVICNTTTQP